MENTNLIGDRGELEMEMLLRNRGIRYITNMYIKTSKGTTQVDFIVFHKGAVSLFEVKNFSGCIVTGDIKRSRWCISYYQRRESMYNPYMQNLNHICMLKRASGARELYLNNYVLFNDTCKLNITGDKNPRTIFKFSELDSLFNNTKSRYSEKEMDYIYEEFAKLKDKGIQYSLEHSNKFKDRM